MCLNVSNHSITYRATRTGLLVLLASALVFGFIRLTSEILEGDTLRFDETILLALRHTSGPCNTRRTSWLTKVMTDLTALGGTTC